MKSKQASLPGLTDWREPQTARGSDLLATITRANAAGFKAVRMTVKHAAVYELQFIRFTPDGSNEQKTTTEKKV